MPKSNFFICFSAIEGLKLIPNKEYSLNTNDVIIYTIFLPDFIDIKSDLAKFLNSKELNRVERFLKEIDKNRFIICRSILKFVLAAHTKLDVKNIQFDFHHNKKPYLASYPWLHFNISHSEDYAVIAISRNIVGIDIEYLSKDFNFVEILPDIFNDNEILAIQNAANKKHAFYTYWTRKEAFVKALGKGIDEDFKSIPCLNGKHSINTSLLKTSENWQVYSFELVDYYLIAVAFENLTTISKNLILFAMPNTMKSLLEMTQLRND